MRRRALLSVSMISNIELDSFYIYYTSIDGNIVTPFETDVFRANIVSNDYINGHGIISFDKPVTSIGDYAFYNCKSLTSITIPDSVTEIGDYAFEDCDSLTSITIPNRVKMIGSYAFASCTGDLIINSKIVKTYYTYNDYPSYYGWLKGAKFTRLTIGDSVTLIGDYAFCNCNSLTSVTIGDSVTEIGWSAFAYCSSLTSVTIPDSVTTIGECVFCECDSLTDFSGKFASEDGRCLIINGVLTSFAPYGLTEYTIPDSVTAIGDSAFHGCDRLTSVTIGDSVTEIGWSAFAYCSSLTSVTIPDSVTEIGDEAFIGCSSLTSVTIGNGVTRIGQSVFEDCDSLTSITIPDSVTTIGRWAFSWCESLTSVYCKATIPPALDGTNVFVNNGSGRKIYVPVESVDAYKSAEYWSKYADAIVGYDF